MDEKADNRIRRTFQESKTGEPNIYSVLCQGEDGKTTPLSTNSNNNYIGRGSPSLDNLHDRTQRVDSPNNSKCNGISENGEDQIYVRDISSNDESGKYPDITMIPIECCPNKERTQNLQLSLGELRRIGVLAGHAWTEEKPKTPCRLVVPYVQYRQKVISETMSNVSMEEKKDESREGDNNPKNSFIIVKMVANKSDRKRVAESLDCYIENRNPTTYKCYLEVVKMYGFDHIILIGDCYEGILFLDCYGHVFEWGSMLGVLWSLGDYWGVVSKEYLARCVIWGVEFDGTVTEFEDDKN
ncbi:10437_t:CDS:2, partial [Acaulospora morrowiae]